MRKLLLLIVTVFAAFTLTSCGGGNTPKGVAEQFIKAIQKQDGERMAKLIYFPDDKTPQSDAEREQLNALMTSKLATTYENNGKLESYEILSEELSEDGNSAVVAVKLNYEKRSSEDKLKLTKDGDGNWKIDMRK